MKSSIVVSVSIGLISFFCAYIFIPMIYKIIEIWRRYLYHNCAEASRVLIYSNYFLLHYENLAFYKYYIISVHIQILFLFVDSFTHQVEQRKLVIHNAGLVEYARSQGFAVVDTFNMTMARYKDFLQGKCACHFHRVRKSIWSLNLTWLT